MRQLIYNLSQIAVFPMSISFDGSKRRNTLASPRELYTRTWQTRYFKALPASDVWWPRPFFLRTLTEASQLNASGTDFSVFDRFKEKLRRHSSADLTAHKLTEDPPILFTELRKNFKESSALKYAQKDTNQFTEENSTILLPSCVIQYLNRTILESVKEDDENALVVSSEESRRKIFGENEFPSNEAIKHRKLSSVPPLTMVEEKSEEEIKEVNSSNDEFLCSGPQVTAGERKVLNLYEAFGILENTQMIATEPPKIVIETYENRIMKRKLVPYKHSFEGRWFLIGQRICEFMGHAFIEYKNNPSILACFRKGSTLKRDSFKCRDCHFVCHKICMEDVKHPCPVASILTIEISFPYDEGD